MIKLQGLITVHLTVEIYVYIILVSKFSQYLNTIIEESVSFITLLGKSSEAFINMTYLNRLLELSLLDYILFEMPYKFMEEVLMTLA